jgi:hypothetical protein
LQNREVVRLPLGGDTRVWKDWQKDLPAEVVPLSGREFTAASAEHGEITARMEIHHMARSDVALDHGTFGAEFAVWGDDPMAAVVGVATAGASLTTVPGGDAAGIGWNLGAGTVLFNGGAVAAGLPVLAKGEIAGVLVEVGAPTRLKLYLNGVLVHQRDIGLTGPLHFSASLAATEAGGLCMAVNAGQWGASSPAAQVGWRLPAASPAVARLADADWLTAPGDSPANARFEGVLADGITLISEINFWPWGGEPVSQTSAAECQALDADGVLDDLALSGASGAPAQVRVGPADGMADHPG